MTRVAVLGLGRMGTAIAERLELAGHDLCVWNRTASACAQFAERGAIVLERPAQAWGHAELTITMLADGDALEEVASGEGGLLDADATGVLIDMSTVSATSSARVAEACARAGVAYLRAPVSGNPAVVRAGNLGIIASGPRELYDRWAQLLAEIGPRLFYVGPDEQARVVKLGLNLMIGGTAELLAEALVLAERHGIDRRAMLEVIGGSAIGSPFVSYKTDALVADDYSSTFSTRLMDKDLALVLDAARAVDVPLPVVAVVQQLIRGVIALGMGDDDFSALLPRLRRDAGLS